ncbi:hypothetical protein [Streptomyces sp. NPDC057199]|uniref:hypothetical protein n=1 Tax=Streptomyces sp. NPDC057199 TaxID=3346047 RepID=UPI0036427C1F
MNAGPGAGRLTADWAVLGKYPGQVMGYEVLDGSLPTDRAATYLWGSTTGSPDSREPAAVLPWRVFLGSVGTDPTPVCATVETTWDGSRDGTGSPSYAWRLFLLDWSQAGTARLTWSALDAALPRDDQPLSGAAVPLSVARSTGEQLARLVDELGFEWAARTAALLLDNRQVAIVPPPGAMLPDVDERVLILDAVCALLPYGCRSWLSAATWTGRADHEVRLVFAAAPRSGQVEVRLGTGSPPEPQSDTARSYLTELLRLRAKPRPTAELVDHLLGWTEVIPLRSPGEALRVLRRADLLDSVIEAIRHGQGDLNDVEQLLTQYAMDSLGEHRLAVLVPYLARCASQGAADGLAQTLLRRYWSRSVPNVLAEDVLVLGSTGEAIERARSHLELARNLETELPGVFDELLTVLVTAPHQSHEWTGTLVYMVERTMGRTPESVDALLIRDREAGLAWLRIWLAHRGRDLASLVRLVDRAAGLTAGGSTGWLRFAAVLTGRPGAERATERDAAEFMAAHEEAWESALDVVVDQNRSAAVALLWPRLRQIAQVPEEQGAARLLSRLERLVPPADADLQPETAAAADLLCALCATDGAGSPRGMTRFRRLTDSGTRDTYVAALSHLLNGDATAKTVVTETLLGEVPDADCWQALTLLMRQLPTMERLVCDRLDPRIADDHVLWLQLDLPGRIVTNLSSRAHLRWLRPVQELRGAVCTPQSMERLARAIAAGSPGGVISSQLLAALEQFIHDEGPEVAYSLAAQLHFAAPDLDLALYGALHRGDRGRRTVRLLDEFHEMEAYRHVRLRAALHGRTHSGEPPRSSEPQSSAALPPSAYASVSMSPASGTVLSRRHARRIWRWRWRFRRPDWLRGFQ